MLHAAAAGRAPDARADSLARLADAAYAAAIERAPSNALIRVEQARANLALRRPVSALAAARQIVALYPEAATGHALEGGARLMLGQREQARAALRRALGAHWEDGSESQRRAVEELLGALDQGRAIAH